MNPQSSRARHARPHKGDEFVVTTRVRGSSRTQVWDASHPLAIGHPLQWVVERTEKGVRVRNLAASFRGIQTGSTLKEIPASALHDGTELDLPHLPGASPADRVSLKIRPVHHLVPAFRSTQGSSLAVYACAGNWVVDSRVLSGGDTAPYDATVSGKTAFTLSKASSDAWALLPVVEGLGLRSPQGAETALAKGQRIELSLEQLSQSSLTLLTQEKGLRTWRFALSENPAIPVSKPGEIQIEADVVRFNQALRYTGVAFAAFLVLSWLWPAPKQEPEVLIPPQFAKIVMTKPKSADGPAAGAKSDTPNQVAANAPKKVQEAAVVQAFRAKALSNAVSGLLKGGMTKLMAQSDFAQGTAQSQDARRIFDGKSSALRATGPDTGLSDPRNVQIAAVGGSGGGGGGVGYGKGQHAGVKGQGGSFVTMDTGASSVDEGLTKDEVGEVIHRHMSEVRYCYESAMIRTPDIEGKLITNFVIGGNGMVKSTEVKSSTLPDPRLDDCLLRRLASWKFPNPRGGVDVAVSYPFIFKTLGR